MLAIIGIVVLGAGLASITVIAASMLSSRLSRAEDQYLADESERGMSNPEGPVADAPQPTP